MMDVIELTKKLVSYPSITPEDAGCQKFLIDYLQQLGFTITQLPFGKVKNFWAQYGTAKPLFVYAGHTDVVPTGTITQWQYNPFQATEKDNLLYGRGVADMKGGIAAMVSACEQFLVASKNFTGSIAFLITGDEEGEATNGTTKVVDYLQQQNIIPDYCLVGEPSCSVQLGDTIKNGRRGSLNGKLTINGKQGHIAYPHLAENPIHLCLRALSDLTETQWDTGNDYFPATQLQISNIHSGTGATNVIPQDIIINFNLRYSSELTTDKIKHQVKSLLDKHKLNYQLDWQLSGEPFLTKPGKLVNACQQAIKAQTGLHAKLSTDGGTSDGRFIARLGCEIIEFGLRNNTIHQIDEAVDINDLKRLATIYQQLLTNLLP